MWRSGGGEVDDVDTEVEGYDGVPGDPVRERGNQGEEEKEGTEASSKDKAAEIEAHTSGRIDVGGVGAELQ